MKDLLMMLIKPWLVIIPVDISCLRTEEKPSLVTSSLKKQEKHWSVRRHVKAVISVICIFNNQNAWLVIFLIVTHENTVSLANEIKKFLIWDIPTYMHMKWKYLITNITEKTKIHVEKRWSNSFADKMKNPYFVWN